MMSEEMMTKSTTVGLETLYSLRSEYGSELHNLVKTATTREFSKWKNLGGCETCLGYEKVVTWSTMDGSGYTEYGLCKNCTPESKAAGKAPASYWSGGYHAASAGLLSLDEMFALPEYRAEAVLANTYNMHMEFLNAAIADEEDRLTVKAGKDVVVVKGRKVPKGTTGRCFWIGETKYGTRAGFTTADGTTHWTAKSNLEVAA
jgi:hypothetical protein